MTNSFESLPQLFEPMNALKEWIKLTMAPSGTAYGVSVGSKAGIAGLLHADRPTMREGREGEN